jgi:hypothetical protein
MEIREFEKAFRAAVGDDLIRPALATSGGSNQIDVQLPTEFRTATKTLASRAGEQPKETSILRAVAEMWS